MLSRIGWDWLFLSKTPASGFRQNSLWYAKADMGSFMGAKNAVTIAAG